MQHTGLQDIIDRLESAIVDAEQRGYERGLSDARRRIQDALASDDRPGAAAPTETQQRVAVPNAPKNYGEVATRKRAPRGLVRKVIVRELMTAPGGLTPAEIQERARTADERMIVASSYRSELRVGRDAGRYRDEGGKWFLAETAKAGEVVESHPPAFAFGETERG